jgi:hypothetical protein
MNDVLRNNISVFEENKRDFLAFENRKFKPETSSNNALSFNFINHLTVERTLEVRKDVKGFINKFYQLDSLSSRGMISFSMVWGFKEKAIEALIG